MNNGKQCEQLLKVLGGHSASLDRTSKCRGLSEQPLYSGGHKAMQHETRNWNNFDKCELKVLGGHSASLDRTIFGSS